MAATMRDGHLGDEGTTGTEAQKRVRVWCDGCYDLTHFGHANSLRQAKALGDYLIVGVHSDEDIAQQKALPIFTHDERCEMIRAIKWVDEVVPNVPYTTTPEILDNYDCDFTAHGNDRSITADGKDTYQDVKDVNRYKEYERTHGVSTTDLINRILKATRSPKSHDPNIYSVTDSLGVSPYTGSSQFLPTTKKLMEFAIGKEPAAGSKVVYTAGSFDILNPGHLAFLKAAKNQGDFLIVGIHSDSLVHKYKGSIYPVSNLFERVFAVLACRYVDEVIIGAPFVVSKDLIENFHVQLVVHGKIPVPWDSKSVEDPYQEPKVYGIFKEIDSGSTLTTQDIVERVTKNRVALEARNAKKEKKERAMFENFKSES